MACRETLRTLVELWEEPTSSDEIVPHRSHQRGRDLTDQSRILDVERAERAERAALLQRAERLCSSQQARSNAVLERLGLSVQQSTPASPQPPAPRTRSSVTSVSGREVGPIFSFEEKSQPDMTNQMQAEDSPFFERKLRLGSQMAMVGGKLAALTARARRPSPDGSVSSLDSLCTADTHTPRELRAISHLRSPTTLSPTPTPPQTVAHRRGPPQPPAPPKRTTLAPAAPSTPAPKKRKGPRPGTNLRAVKADDWVVKDNLQPSVNPVASLSLCFRQLGSEDWEKKMEGLKSVRALARHHPEVLLSKLHEVCLVLTEEVKNLRSVVASAAMEAIAELHHHLGKAMDPEAETTGRALLLKLAQTTSIFIHQQANLALDALVKGCSPGRVVSALLNTGLSHRCAAVRGSTAQHLHQLADINGAGWILTAGKIFSGRFITAVSKMLLDAAPEVRNHGQKMLRELAPHKEFMVLFNKIVPVKDRRPLEKILRKL